MIRSTYMYNYQVRFSMLIQPLSLIPTHLKMKLISRVMGWQRARHTASEYCSSFPLVSHFILRFSLNSTLLSQDSKHLKRS